MRIPIDRKSDMPLYRQIEQYLRHGILTGSLVAGTRLPAARQLARDLGVNRITVENAYSELETDNLIYGRVGSGTFVSPPTSYPPLPVQSPGAPWPLWQQEIQSRMGLLRSSLASNLQNNGKHPATINFAGGIGDAHLFPGNDFRKVIQSVMRRDGQEALDYGDRRGYAPLRETIARILASQGIQTHADNVLITAGSQQALSLAAQLVLRPGDVILIEDPTYAGALDLFRSLGYKVVGIPVDERGLQVENLEKILQLHHPKLIYTIPNFQNPTGTNLSGSRRRQLITLADRYNVPILEDDFVGDLRYEGRALPALKALDPGGRVIYVSTFSKMLMPGLRVGFLVVDGPVYESLLNFKRVNDLATSNLIQRALEAYVTVGRYQAHLRRTILIYRKRRDAMLQSIRTHLPDGVQVLPPQGGLFAWLRLPDQISAEQLLPFALEEGVAYSPGSLYYIDPAEGADFMRLNFTMQPPEEIDEGIRRLGKAIQRFKIEARQHEMQVD